MAKFWLVCALTVMGVLAAPQAAAEPADLVPYCSGDPTPMDSNCRATLSQVFTHDGWGVSPDLPFGTNPDEQPAL
jgi:hypothetical protein